MEACAKGIYLEKALAYFYLGNTVAKIIRNAIDLLSVERQRDTEDGNSEISRQLLHADALRLAMHQRNEMHFSALGFDCFLAADAELKLAYNTCIVHPATYIQSTTTNLS